MENAKEKKDSVITNVIWRFAEKWGCQATTFVVTIVIARILNPDAYGIVAIVNSFIQIFTIFIDAGLGTSLVQKKDSDDLDFSTVFVANFILCVFIYLIIYALAPLIAKYYEILDLTILLRVSSISIIIYSLKNVQEAYISKHLLFKNFFFSSLAGTIGAGVVGILMAINGFGAWALIVSHLFDVIVDTIVMIFTVRWHPSFRFSLDRFKPLFKFSSRLLVSGLLNRLYNKMYHLLIGKYYSSSDLAYYDKGNNFTTKVTDNTDSVINYVLFPVMSKKQDDKNKLKNIAKRALTVNTYIVFPLLIGLFTVSNSVVKVLLTDKWLPAVPFIQLFCLINLFLPMQTINTNIIKSIGKSDIILKQEVIVKVIGVIIIITTLRYSVIMVVVGKLILNVIYYIVYAYPNKKIIEYGILEQIKDILPNLIISILMGLFVYFVGKINANILFVLVIQIVVGGLIYVLLSYITKNDSFNYLISTIKTKIKQKG